MTSIHAPRLLRTAFLLAVLLLSAACVQGAASTTGCPAFRQWQAAGFPDDLTSADAGPRYLRFLAETQDQARAVADEAGDVLAVAQRIHDAWAGAGGAQGPADQTIRAEELGRELDTPAVRAALDEVAAYGRETCGVEVPSDVGGAP